MRDLTELHDIFHVGQRRVIGPVGKIIRSEFPSIPRGPPAGKTKIRNTHVLAESCDIHFKLSLRAQITAVDHRVDLSQRSIGMNIQMKDRTFFILITSLRLPGEPPDLFFRVVLNIFFSLIKKIKRLAVDVFASHFFIKDKRPR